MQQRLLSFKTNRKKRSRSRKAAYLGILASVASAFQRRRRDPIGPADLQRHDYSTSTQRLGIRFTERIRRTFRFRWLSKT